MSLINLQIFLSFFFQMPKKKQGTATPNGEFRTSCKKPILRVEFYKAPDAVIADGSDDELAVEEEGIATDAAAMPDDGRDAHDSAIVKTTCDKAIEMMRLEGIDIDDEEEKMALQLFP